MQQTFEITIYNEQVRVCVQNGDHHKDLSDGWGDSHYIEFKAEDEAAAIAKCECKYPQAQGFVVESVLPA